MVPALVMSHGDWGIKVQLCPGIMNQATCASVIVNSPASGIGKVVTSGDKRLH